MHIPSSGGSRHPRKIAPQGSHPMRCLFIIDLGTQETNYKNVPGKTPQVILGFELVNTNEVMREGESPKPFVVNEKYNKSMGPNSNLYKDICSWIGRQMSREEIDAGYSIQERLGKPGIINIIHNPKKNDPEIVYANVGTIMPVIAGMPEPPPLRNPMIYFKIGMPNQFDVFANIYPWIQELIAKSPEFQSECAKYNVNAAQIIAQSKERWTRENNIQPRQQQPAGQYQQPQQNWQQQPAGQYQQPQQNWQQPAPQPSYQQQPPQVQYPAAPNPQYNPPAPNYGQPQYPNQQPQQQPGYPQGQPPMQQQPQFQQPAPHQFQQPVAPPASHWNDDANVYTGQDNKEDPF